MYKFSATAGIFYPSDSLQDYKNLPTDLIDADDATFYAAINRPTGATLAVVSGIVVIVPAPAPTAEQQFLESKIQFQNAIQQYVSKVALKQGEYDSEDRLAGYAADPYPAFAADAIAFIHWRSSVWLKCYADLAAVQAGTMAMPTSPADYIMTLPAVPAGF